MLILPVLCEEQNGKLQTKQTCILQIQLEIVDRTLRNLNNYNDYESSDTRGTGVYTRTSCELWNIFDCVQLSRDYFSNYFSSKFEYIRFIIYLENRLRSALRM